MSKNETITGSVLLTTEACEFCGGRSRFELTTAEYHYWRNGAPIPDAMPERARPERETIRSGIHPECWTNAFGTDDDDE